MPWVGSVNKNAVINAVHTTLDVENMPLTSWVRALRSITLSRQTEICRALDNGLWAVCSDDLKNIRFINVSIQDVTVRVKGYCFDTIIIILFIHSKK